VQTSQQRWTLRTRSARAMEGMMVRGTNLLGQAACVRAFPRDLRKSFGGSDSTAQHCLWFPRSFCLAGVRCRCNVCCVELCSVVLCCDMVQFWQPPTPSPVNPLAAKEHSRLQILFLSFPSLPFSLFPGYTTPLPTSTSLPLSPCPRARNTSFGRHARPNHPHCFLLHCFLLHPHAL